MGDLFDDLSERHEEIVANIKKSLEVENTLEERPDDLSDIGKSQKWETTLEEPSDNLADRILKEFRERRNYFDDKEQLLALSCLGDDYIRSLSISQEYMELAGKEGIDGEKREAFLGSALRLLARAGKVFGAAKTIYPSLDTGADSDSLFGVGVVYRTAREYLANLSLEIRAMCEFPSNAEEMTDKLTLLRDAKKHEKHTKRNKAPIFELLESSVDSVQNGKAQDLNTDLTGKIRAEYDGRNGDLSKKEMGLIQEYLLNDYHASRESAKKELSEAQRKISKNKGDADEKREESLYRASKLIRRAKKDLLMRMEIFPEKYAIDLRDKPEVLLEELDDLFTEVRSTWEYNGSHKKIALLLKGIKETGKYGHEDEVTYRMQALNRLVREPMPKWGVLEMLINSKWKNSPEYLPDNFGDMIMEELELRMGSLTYNQKWLIRDYFLDDYRKVKDAAQASMKIAKVLGSAHGNYQDSLYKALSLASRAINDLKRSRNIFPKSEKLDDTQETYGEAAQHLKNMRKEILRLFDNPSAGKY